MDRSTQRQRIESFRHLHRPNHAFVLPNAWDAATARVFEQAGFSAIGTTSAGVAASLGYADGQYISPDLMLQAIKRIVEATTLPVTADLEAGYGKTIKEVLAIIKKAADLGIAGFNLEDAVLLQGAPKLVDVSFQKEKITAIREYLSSENLPLVLNARTDVFVLSQELPEQCLQQAIQRANAYRDAGADCLFFPGVSESSLIRTLVEEVHGPLNILATAATPPVSDLQRLGVTRVSLGSGPMRASLALTRQIAQELLEKGTYTTFTRDAFSYAALLQLFPSQP